MMIMTSFFPDVPIFLQESGQITVEAMGMAGGLVTGSFSGVFSSMDASGTKQTYTISGSFKFKRTV